jgi:non-specific serine/threonine protein kinase
MDDQTWESAWEEGARLSLEEAVAYALANDDPAVPGAAAERRPLVLPPKEPLSPREREVADLVARGLTNRQIAEALVITERTAETHLERIYSKLELHSRAQLATWLAEHDRIATS